MSQISTSRNHAAECLELAGTARDPTAKQLFLETAQLWHDLANTLSKLSVERANGTGAARPKKLA